MINFLKYPNLEFNKQWLFFGLIKTMKLYSIYHYMRTYVTVVPSATPGTRYNFLESKVVQCRSILSNFSSSYS